MATHYEILGVNPDAEHDVVKRAYLDHALRFHPDRLEDRSADAIERAQFRMHEINDAWRVLRNPAARAHYDDQLREQREQKVLAGVGASSASAAAPTMMYGGASSAVASPTWRRSYDLAPDDIAELAPEDRAIIAPTRSPWRMWGPVIVCGVVLAIVVIVAGTAAGKHDSGVKLQTVEQYATGTCVAVTVDDSQATTDPGGQARPVIVSVPCTGPNSGKVVARSDFPVPCPNGSRAVILPGATQSLCLVS